MTQEITLEQLPQFAETFWRFAKGCRVFAFHGEMGAGKTTLISALCRHKGVEDAVSSPTFSIINEYRYEENGVQQPIFHIDLYRLKDPEEVVQTGVEDCITSGALCLVEWPEKAPDLFDESTAHVFITAPDAQVRTVTLTAPQQSGSGMAEHS